MKLKLRKRYAAISVSAALTLLLAVATPAAAGKAQLAGRTAGSETQSKTIDIVGTNILAINQYVKTTYHFKPGTVRVKQGNTIVLTNQTTDAHTFSLVDPSLLPKTVGAVFNCGAPGTICGAVAAAHLPNGFPSGPPSSTPPPTCPQPNNAPCVVFVIDGGQPGSSPLGLDTAGSVDASGAFTGDSVIMGPGQPPVSMTVTANPGTVLHFICAFHAWMQGELVVTRSDGN